MAGNSNGHSSCDQPVEVDIYDLGEMKKTGEKSLRVIGGKACSRCFIAFASHDRDVVQLGPDGPLVHERCQKNTEARARRATATA